MKSYRAEFMLFVSKQNNSKYYILIEISKPDRKGFLYNSVKGSVILCTQYQCILVLFKIKTRETTQNRGEKMK